jgi:tetratricopeptide (TPR) repeat protein
VRAFLLSPAGAALTPIYRINVLLALAEASMRSGDDAQADNDVKQALALRRHDGTSAVPAMKLGQAKALAGVLLLKRGLPADALGALRDAQVDLSRALGPDHFLTCLFSLDQALALQALGRVDEATVLMDHAEPVLLRTLDPASPLYARVKQFRAQLERSESDARSGSSSRMEFFL